MIIIDILQFTSTCSLCMSKIYITGGGQGEYFHVNLMRCLINLLADNQSFALAHYNISYIVICNDKTFCVRPPVPN